MIQPLRQKALRFQASLDLVRRNNCRLIALREIASQLSLQRQVVQLAQPVRHWASVLAVGAKSEISVGTDFLQWRLCAVELRMGSRNEVMLCVFLFISC